MRPKLLKPVRPEDLAKLEVFCFANCATEMKYVDERLSLPRIESFGNEHDLVARLGMLAPDPDKRQIQISGARFRHDGAWGHLLNAHYLTDIDRAQRQRLQSVTPNAERRTVCPDRSVGTPWNGSTPIRSPERRSRD